MWRAPVVLLVVSVVVLAAAQERLPEVAADIELRQPTEDAVLVDPDPGPDSSQLAVIDGQELRLLTEELVELAVAVNELLGKAAPDDTFFEEAWREQMLELCRQLQDAGRSLEVRHPSPRYSEAFVLVTDASAECNGAVEVIRASIAQNEQLYSRGFGHLGIALQRLDEGLVKIREVGRTELAESDPPAEDPMAAESAIAAGCGDRFAADTRAFDECVALQRTAYAAISSRYNSSGTVDQAGFNSIRNSCRSEFADDFVARNLCERDRIVAAQAE
jgi:hypothetical protein